MVAAREKSWAEVENQITFIKYTLISFEFSFLCIPYKFRKINSKNKTYGNYFFFLLIFLKILVCILGEDIQLKVNIINNIELYL